MLCESCHQRDALVHLTKTVRSGISTDSGEVIHEQPQPDQDQELHFCKECADAYFSCTPGMNSARNLICLSDWYRKKLYGLLEAAHPEAFDDSDTEACERGSEVMRGFLQEQLKKDGIDVNEDAFDMLLSDFFGSHHFSSWRDEFNKRNGATRVLPS